MPFTRRAFARKAAVVAAAAAVAPSVIAQTTPAPQSSSPDAESRINAINARYGSRLSDEQRADVRRIITGGQAGLDAMRAYPLSNDVEPALPFRIYRKDVR